MYIKRIKAKNILSYEKLDIKLNKLNVIIGPNASGKTNFVHILDFIRNTVLYGLSDAISNQGGIKYFTNINIGATNKSELEFEIDSNSNEPKVFFSSESIGNKFSVIAVKICNFKYSLVLDFETKSLNSWSILNETINSSIEISFWEDIDDLSDIDNLEDMKGGRLGNVQLHFTNNKGQFQYKYSKSIDFPKQFEKLLKFPFPTRVLKDQNYNEKKSILERDILFPYFIPIRNFLEKISIYKINPQLSRFLLQQSGKVELEPDGTNLASALENILNDSKKKKKFILIIKDLLPFIDSFQIKKRKKKILEFGFREIYLKSKDLLPSFLMSSGTIDLAIYTIIFYFEKKKFIVIEEPGTNIHPQLISKFIEMMKDVSMNLGKQIIITTHNPEIIKYAGIENLIAINRNENGYSEIYRPSDKEEIKIFLKNKLGIDELFIENLI